MLEYAQKFENTRRELKNALTELRNQYTGRLIIGANESGALYLLTHIRRFRELYPGVKIEVRRALTPGSAQVVRDLQALPGAGVRFAEPAPIDMESTLLALARGVAA